VLLLLELVQLHELMLLTAHHFMQLHGNTGPEEKEG
jgi:hypothetical protein